MTCIHLVFLLQYTIFKEHRTVHVETGIILLYNLLLQMMFLQNCDSFVVGHTTVDAIIRTTDFYYCPLHNSNFHFLILFS